MQGGNLVTKIQIWNETENFTINGESCMYFNFHKGMPKINQVIGLKVKVRNLSGWQYQEQDWFFQLFLLLLSH